MRLAVDTREECERIMRKKNKSDNTFAASLRLQARYTCVCMHFKAVTSRSRPSNVELLSSAEIHRIEEISKHLMASPAR